MEKSATKNPERGRALPIVLLMLGLACMSWLTIQRTTPEEDQNEMATEEPMAPDTVIKQKSKREPVSIETKTITRWDKNGVPHEEVVQVIEGEDDEMDWDLWETPMAVEFPGVPDMPEMVVIPDFPDMAYAPMPLDFSFDSFSDSLPRKYSYRFNEDEWKAFEEEFKTKFREQFKDFWSKNGSELEKLLDAAHDKSFSAQGFNAELADQMRMAEKAMAAMPPKMFDMEKFEMDLKRSEFDLRKQEFDMKKMAEDMKYFEDDMKVWEKNAKVYEAELKEMLVKDGYLKSGEEVKNLNIRGDDGDIEVNGKKIKDSDKPKYAELHRKHFGKTPRFHRIEE